MTVIKVSRDMLIKLMCVGCGGISCCDCPFLDDAEACEQVTDSL